MRAPEAQDSQDDVLSPETSLAGPAVPPPAAPPMIAVVPPSAPVPPADEVFQLARAPEGTRDPAVRMVRRHPNRFVSFRQACVNG
jgi:hypothetical protein